MDSGEYLLSRHPRKVTVADARLWIEQGDDEAKQNLADLIYHRLNHRYIEPILQIPRTPVDYKSGFLIMAVSCLLIETLQSFFQGLRDIRNSSERAFENFFGREKQLFPGFADKDVNFYKNIRCGILHQAETTGGYRILRTGRMLDKKKKTINATKFIEALDKRLKEYICELRTTDFTDDLWRNATAKIKSICDNCSC